jgi:hypothetical protein
MNTDIATWITAGSAVVAAISTAVYAVFTVRLWRTTQATAQSTQEMVRCAQETRSARKRVPGRQGVEALLSAEGPRIL